MELLTQEISGKNVIYFYLKMTNTRQKDLIAEFSL